MTETRELTKSFYVNLPSNASASVYPLNTNGNYRVRLDRPIKIDGDKWSVGICAISYTRSWYNVERGVISWSHNQWESLDAFANGETPVRRYQSVAMNKGAYSSVDDVISAFYDATYPTLLRGSVFLKRDRSANRIHYGVHPDSKHYEFRVHLSDDLSQILGFDEGDTLDSPRVSSRAPDINRGMTALYVYSNVVDNRHVGDAYVPLLRAVPVESAEDARTYAIAHTEFKNVEYHKAANFHGRDVEILIARDNGKRVDFATGTVDVTLHFRRDRAEKR